MVIIIWHCCILRSNDTVRLRAISDRKRRIRESYGGNTDSRIDGLGSYVYEKNLKRKLKKNLFIKIFTYTKVIVYGAP